MKRIIISLLLIVPFLTISCGNTGTADSKATQEQKTGTFKNVSVTDLNTAISEGGDIVVLDVRTPGEVSQGYVDGALNMDVNGSNFKNQAAELDKNKIIYVYCRSGHRSQNASKILISMGFSDVRNVEGGFIAWSQKGYKSVK